VLATSRLEKFSSVGTRFTRQEPGDYSRHYIRGPQSADPIEAKGEGRIAGKSLLVAVASPVRPSPPLRSES